MANAKCVGSVAKSTCGADCGTIQYIATTQTASTDRRPAASDTTFQSSHNGDGTSLDLYGNIGLTAPSVHRVSNAGERRLSPPVPFKPQGFSVSRLVSEYRIRRMTPNDTGVFPDAPPSSVKSLSSGTHRGPRPIKPQGFSRRGHARHS